MSASNILQKVGITTISLSTSLQFFLSGVMTQMWTMVNALQSIHIMSLINTALPGNLCIFLNALQSISSFDLFQAQLIISLAFDFSPTEPPLSGFEQMGSSSKRMIPEINTTFLFLCWTLILIFFLWICQ